MIKIMEKLTVLCVLACLLFSSGCGILGIAGSPSSYEGKIPAEYNLAAQKNKKILVLVEEPAGLDTQANIRFYLSEAITKNLMAKNKAKIPSKSFIPYKQLYDYRSNSSNFPLLSAPEVGKALGADLVLLVMIEDFQLNQMPEMENYYSGILKAQIAVVDPAEGGQVWPGMDMGKTIQVGFEIERDKESAVGRLVNAAAHCTSRYFYNCPKYKFKSSDEGKKVGWDE